MRCSSDDFHLRAMIATMAAVGEVFAITILPSADAFMGIPGRDANWRKSFRVRFPKQFGGYRLAVLPATRVRPFVTVARAQSILNAQLRRVAGSFGKMGR